MDESTSALTFKDLIIEVARKIGLGHHGSDGLGPVEAPVNAHDLDECKRHVNNGIRMFFSDAPKPNGWRFSRPIASVVLWPSITVLSTDLITSSGHDPGTDKTTLVVASAPFFPSMELRSLVVTGVGTFTITDYVSTTTVRVSGNATGAGVVGVTWSLLSVGDYTLPRTFSGLTSGSIRYEADTDESVRIDWSSDTLIRQWRESNSDDFGDPYLAAVRPASGGATLRRWELMVYPTPDEQEIVEFPFDLHFDKLVDLDEVPPAPIIHDYTILAACLATVEKDVEERQGVDWDTYHQKCLLNSHQLDARSAPRGLGYFGSGTGRLIGIQGFRENAYQRPVVAVNT